MWERRECGEVGCDGMGGFGSEVDVSVYDGVRRGDLAGADGVGKGVGVWAVDIDLRVAGTIEAEEMSETLGG